MIALLNLVVFFPKLWGQFLGDDFALNLHVANFDLSVENLFALGLYRGSPYFYRPVPIITWVGLYRLFGLAPAYWHVLTLALHIGNGVLVYFLVDKVLLERAAFVTACIFSVYTGHLEAVLWSCCLFDSVYTLFVLISLLSLTGFLNTKKMQYVLLCFVSTILALLSKEPAAMLPAIAAVWSAVLLVKKGFESRHVLLWAVVGFLFFLVVFGYWTARAAFLRYHGIGPPDFPSITHLNILLNYAVLFGSLVFPHYGAGAISEWLPLVAACFLAALAVVFLVRADSRIAIVLGVAWIVVTAIPIAIMTGVYGYGDLAASRWNYLPSLGFCMILGQLLSLEPSGTRWRRFKSLLPCAAVFLYSVNTIYHNHYWTKAWRASGEIQTHFRAEIMPLLREPAKVYFYNVPDSLGRVGIFFGFLPDCFSSITGDKECEYYQARRGFGARVRSPEDVVLDDKSWNYQFFAWDSTEKRFKRSDVDFKEPISTAASGNAVLHSWDFSRYWDFRRWEAAHDLAIVRDVKSNTSLFLTTGETSFLKSPWLNGSRIKYVQLSYSATNPEYDSLEGHLFWVTKNDMEYDDEKSIRFPVTNDRSTHTYTLPLYVNAWFPKNSEILRLAIRPSNRPNTSVKMESIVLYSY